MPPAPVGNHEICCLLGRLQNLAGGGNLLSMPQRDGHIARHYWA
jgi:hypothetical protein